MTIERRLVSTLTAGAGVLEGYVAVFGEPSEDLGFIETVRAGAFSNSLRTRSQVVALSGHDTSQVLGNTTAGTLTLVEDRKGLRYHIDLPDTQVARDLAVLVTRGDVRGASMGFRVVRDEWDYDSTPMRRELIEVELIEISITALPAYPSTTVAKRHLQSRRFVARRHLDRFLRIEDRR